MHEFCLQLWIVLPEEVWIVFNFPFFISKYDREVLQGGKYVITFLDEYGVSLSVLFIVMCEMVAVCWFYGIRRFSEDIHRMLGFYPGLYWRFCWTCCPVFIAVGFRSPESPTLFYTSSGNAQNLLERDATNFNSVGHFRSGPILTCTLKRNLPYLYERRSRTYKIAKWTQGTI